MINRTYSLNDVRFLMFIALIDGIILGVLLSGNLAHPQTRITPAEVCKRNGAGWVYTAGVCYGPGTQVPLAQSCRVMRGPIDQGHPVTPWESCKAAYRTERKLLSQAHYAWSERREAK